MGNMRRDPRFDNLSGDFERGIFRQNYGFISDLKRKELKQLKDELKEADDENTRDKIKFLIQRIENQLREESRVCEQDKAIDEERQIQRQRLMEGKKPFYMKKSDKRKLELAQRF